MVSKQGLYYGGRRGSLVCGVFEEADTQGICFTRWIFSGFNSLSSLECWFPLRSRDVAAKSVVVIGSAR